jgi:D-glycero-D-manno-heptose 1,7-bisphosphate phosphatase
MSRIAVFLDRDGTLIEECNYLSKPSQVAFFPETIDALKDLKKFGFVLVMVTNQSGVGRGYFSPEQLALVHNHITEILAANNIQLDGIYFCPHVPEDACSCRKPMPGMALDASRDLDINLTQSYMIGDKPADIGMAKAIGATPILVRTGYGRKWENDPSLTHSVAFVADHLIDAARWIIKHSANQRNKSLKAFPE